MAQLTAKDIERAKEIGIAGKVSPNDLQFLTCQFLARVLSSLDYGIAHPDRPLRHIIPEELLK